MSPQTVQGEDRDPKESRPKFPDGLDGCPAWLVRARVDGHTYIVAPPASWCRMAAMAEERTARQGEKNAAAYMRGVNDAAKGRAFGRPDREYPT
jgi:hypothetical protein